MSTVLAPFPWFGGKSRVAPLVWERFGDVPNYVEPFAGSLAVLLARPHDPKTETVNDLNGYLSNFWRATKLDPEGLCALMDYPVSERDLEARHYWLVTEGKARLEGLKGDPDAFDVKAAAWWCWGLCAWIGTGWCEGSGPWVWDGQTWAKRRGRQGVAGQLPAVGDAGRGINRQVIHVTDQGQGINRQIVHVGNGGMGINRVDAPPFSELISALSARLRRTRICSGDWSRAVTSAVTDRHGITGVFLDPPYSTDECEDVYRTGSVAADVRSWCTQNGVNSALRIALCGYGGEGHESLESAGWTSMPWLARKGYQKVEEGVHSGHRERIWFSPHCIDPVQNMGLFGMDLEPSASKEYSERG